MFCALLSFQVSAASDVVDFPSLVPPLLLPTPDRRRQVSRLFFLVTRRQRRRLTDDLKIGPYQELLEQRARERGGGRASAIHAMMPAGSLGHGMVLCELAD